MKRSVFGVLKSIGTGLFKAKQRVTALFFVALMIFGAAAPVAQAYAQAHPSGPNQSDLTSNASNKNSHKTSTTPSVGTISNSSVPAPQTNLQSGLPAAKDAAPPANDTAANVLNVLTGKADGVAMTSPDTGAPKITPHELVADRTANSTDYENVNGSITKTTYMSPHFYQNNGAWDPIDMKLQTDDNAADSGNPLGKALGKIESMITNPHAYMTRANGWQARFTPSDFKGGIVRIKDGNSQVGFSPVGANAVDPTITTDSNGQETVHYDNLWNGVNVDYLVMNDEVKEAIILNNKDAASQVQFQMVGASLKKLTISKTVQQVEPAFNIDGALNNGFSIMPANLILNNAGYVDDSTSGLTQTYNNGVLTEGISNSYLQSLPDSAFPVVIDPSVVSAFGTRAGGNYVSFKNDGTICYSNQCDLYAGSLIDSGGTQRWWRGAFYSPYDVLRTPGTTLTNADLHLTMMSGSGWGYTGTFNYNAGSATCLSSYSCYGGTASGASANIGTSGDINVTSIYASAISSGDWGRWVMVDGTDGSSLNWKTFNPDYSYVTFTYSNPIPSPTFMTPQASQTFVDRDPSFQLSQETNPNSTTVPLLYRMQITDGSNAAGDVVNSGNFIAAGETWTPPDGSLQDGSTYYVEAQSYDPTTGTSSPWTAPVPFRIDSREGAGKTQTYDTVGPAKVDLATGNLEAGTASHTTAALGGNIGVTLDYNSPLKSRNGLIGSYWNLSSGGSGIPTTTPDTQRVDQNVNFNWGGYSPDGGHINTTWFATQWNGYFVAPQTGTYYFGGINDDWMAVSVNGTSLYSNGGCYSSTCYGSTISLTAGQVVPIQVSYNQVTGPSYAYLYVKTPDGVSQVVPSAWLQTGVRNVAQQRYGLLGKYYSYTDTGSPPSFPSNGTDGLFMTRTDPLVNFSWSGSSPIANGPTTDYMVRWTGNINIPAGGSYTFGTNADDGSDISIDGTSVFSDWTDGTATNRWGTATTLTAGSHSVTVDYYQHLGAASMSLMVEPGGANPQVVPSSWLTPPVAQVLPAGWQLGGSGIKYTELTANQGNAVLSDSSGDTYDYVWNAADNDFTPPTNADGHLMRNDDGSYTFQDSDGTTYLFDGSGALTSVTSPTDDQNPATLKYNYGKIYGSSGPVGLTSTTDGVTSNRYMNVYYSGDTQCGSPPSGFSAAPTDMMCAVQTNDDRTTYFYYDSNGNLAEVLLPGNETTQYEYQSVSNGGTTIGYQLTGIRDSLANDAIAAGERSASDITTYATITYDLLGRVTSVTQPTASYGATQLETTFQYLLGSTEEHVVGATEPNGYSQLVNYDYLFRTTAVYNKLGLATTTEWDPIKDLAYDTTNTEGLMTTSIYDDEDRLVSQYGPAPAADFNRWSTLLANGASMTEGQSLYSPDHRYQFTFQTGGNVVMYGPGSVVLWSSGTAGLTATSLTMQTDGNLVLYNGSTAIWSSGTSGHGPSSQLVVQNDGNAVIYNAYGPTWMTGTGGAAPSPTASGYNTPLTAYTSQVARSDTLYDQSLSGLGVAYQSLSESSVNNASLISSPLLHSTNIATDGTISKDWGTSSSPISGVTSNWGMSMTGTMRLATTGNWNFRIMSDEGIRMYIDGQLVIDDWKDNPNGTSPTLAQTTTHPQYQLNNTVANSVHDVRIDYYHVSGDANFTLYMTPPGGSETTSVATYFSPNYDLPTSSTSYDATYGNTTVNTSYGSNPNLGLATSSTIDPSGLDLSASNTYESPGSGYNRLTSQTSPGGSTTTYTYYGASATATNPCVTGSTAAYQGGMLETTTTPSPDGGTTPGISTTNVYDDAGNIVATETNSDGWECNTYDTRDRLTEEVVPAYNGNASRTITYNFDVSGNPLVTSQTDGSGTVTTTVDLLGRTVSYTDTLGDTTTTTYDSLGRVTSQASPEGTKTFTYDSYDRVIDEKLGSVDLAQTTYDAYGRVAGVAYPAANMMSVAPTYSTTTGVQTGVTYNLNTNTPGSNLVANPSFETASSGSPTGWNQGGWGTNAASFTYASTGHTGSHSGRIDMTSYTSGDAKWYANNVAVVPGTNYTFNDYYESNVATTATVQFTYADGSNSYLTIGSPVASSSWAQASYSFTAPAGAIYATVFHLISSVGYLQIDDSSLLRTQGTQSVSDSVTYSQSGKVASDAVTSGSTTLSSSYGYDVADRLTSATIGSNTYSYGFGTQSSACGSGSNMNANAGMSGNRTTQTINGATTTYCYNKADQLVSSSDATASGDTYDSHGNLTEIGTGSTPLQLFYDSSDRNSALEQVTSSGNGSATYYGRDTQDRMTYREYDTISGWNWTVANQQWFGYNTDGSSPDYAYNSSWDIVDEYVSLPGGVTVTIHPQQTTQASEYNYNLSNFHGDTLLTTDGTGVNNSTGSGPASSFAYDPFGNPVPSESDPSNFDQGSLGPKGGAMKISETALALHPVQMGDRVYLPTIGRFTSMDPVPGGNANAYVYPLDPINFSDLSGDFSIGGLIKSVVKTVASVAKSVVHAVAQVVKAVTTQAVTTSARVPAKAPPVVQQASASHNVTATVKGGTPLVAAATSLSPITDHALAQMAGARGDVGMTDWTVNYILENGTTSSSTSIIGRTIYSVTDLGQVITEADGTIVTVIPRGSQAGPAFQGWFVEVMIALLLE